MPKKKIQPEPSLSPSPAQARPEPSLYLENKGDLGAVWPKDRPLPPAAQPEPADLPEAESQAPDKIFDLHIAEPESDWTMGRNAKILIIIMAAAAFFAISWLAYNYFYARDSAKEYSFVPKASPRDPGGQAADAPEGASGSALNPPAGPAQNFQMDDGFAQIYADKKVDVTQPEALPENSVFKTFFYNPADGKVLEVAGACKDKYFAVLVFSAGDDYKKNPELAKVNSAYACPASGRYGQKLDLAKYNLSRGEYYFFSADQGETGLWYNPR